MAKIHTLPVAARVASQIGTATPTGDRLLHYKQVNGLTGSACKTGHAARNLAARGKIRAVRINCRTVRYSEQSVLELIAGRVAA